MGCGGRYQEDVEEGVDGRWNWERNRGRAKEEK